MVPPPLGLPQGSYEARQQAENAPLFFANVLKIHELGSRKVLGGNSRVPYLLLLWGMRHPHQSLRHQPPTSMANWDRQKLLPGDLRNCAVWVTKEPGVRETPLWVGNS